MSGEDDKGPMQEPRATRDVMTSSPDARSPRPSQGKPTDPATDEATKAVEIDQEVA